MANHTRNESRPGADPIDDAIGVTMPLRPAFASTLRVIVASLGADADFTVDEIDDLKLGVSEVFTLLAEGDSGNGRCSAQFVVDDGAVSVTMARVEHGVDGGELVLDPLAATILASVVDECSIDNAGIRLVKRAAETSSTNA